jgi:hypothetical protein
VWVINPKLARWLEEKRGFEPESVHGDGSAHMVYYGEQTVNEDSGEYAGLEDNDEFEDQNAAIACSECGAYGNNTTGPYHSWCSATDHYGNENCDRTVCYNCLHGQVQAAGGNPDSGVAPNGWYYNNLYGEYLCPEHNGQQMNEGIGEYEGLEDDDQFKSIPEVTLGSGDCHFCGGENHASCQQCNCGYCWDCLPDGANWGSMEIEDRESFMFQDLPGHRRRGIIRCPYCARRRP